MSMKTNISMLKMKEMNEQKHMKMITSLCSQQKCILLNGMERETGFDSRFVGQRPPKAL
jgi:hypothetical protein